MAKQQTFADKAKQKQRSEWTSFKFVVSVQDENTGTWKFRERMVKVRDPKEVESMKA